MKFLTYNIQYGQGRDGQVDIGRIVGEIGDADLVALQEVERFWERSGYADELAEIRDRSPRARAYILASPWHVPLRWFAAFRSSDREIYDLRDGISIRYRTSIGDAVDRVGWAARVLDDAGFSDPVVEQVRDLEQWIAEFPADAMIELDYATVAELFSDGEVTFDESAVEVRTSLEALERGEMDEAGEAYMSVAARWAQRQALTFSN